MLQLTAVRQPTVVQTLGQRWGKAVAERRASVDFSQTQLAELCGVTQQTISKIEAGAMIPHDRLKAVIANHLLIEPSDLFRWPTREEMGEIAS